MFWCQGKFKLAQVKRPKGSISEAPLRTRDNYLFMLHSRDPTIGTKSSLSLFLLMIMKAYSCYVFFVSSCKRVVIEEKRYKK